MMSEKTVFDIFKDDHEQFISVFNGGINLLCTTRNLKIASYLWEYCSVFLEAYHHESEESVLFKTVAKNPKIKNGGPQCTYFYDVQMTNNPLLEVYRELNISDFVIREEHIPIHFKEEFKNKLPIVIPLEEHIAGKLLLEEIHRLINTEGSVDRIIKLFKKYYNIQIFHFKKEETCFFEMCSNLLGQDDLQSAIKLVLQKNQIAAGKITHLLEALDVKVP